MSDIRIWNAPSMYVGGDKERIESTEVVLLSDHIAAVAEAEKRGRSKQRVIDEAQFNYNRGYEDARKVFEVPTGVFDEQSYDTGYWEGYEAGYDAALSNREPKVQVDNPFINDATVPFFNQHGQGENP